MLPFTYNAHHPRSFSYFTTPPLPMSVNIRLLDSTGFALCGKEIDFRFNPQTAGMPVSVSPVGANGKKLSLADRNAAMQAARQSQVTQLQAAEVTREQGKDLFQNQTTADGQVAAINAQGALPCSPPTKPNWGDPRSCRFATKTRFAPPSHLFFPERNAQQFLSRAAKRECPSTQKREPKRTSKQKRATFLISRERAIR